MLTIEHSGCRLVRGMKPQAAAAGHLLVPYRGGYGRSRPNATMSADGQLRPQRVTNSPRDHVCTRQLTY